MKTDDKELVDGVLVRVWKCANAMCPHKQAEESPFIQQKHPTKKLYFDVERGYSKFLSFDRKVPSKYLASNAMIEEGHVLCWAAVWLDENNEFPYVMSNAVRQAESLANDDRRILRDLWWLLDRADYIIGHNSDQYDIKLVHWRFHKHGLSFPLQAKQVDSLKLARKYMMAPSNKLDDLTNGGKSERGDWKEIALTGDPVELLKMEMYCRNDVRIGADWFRKLARDIEASGRKVWN